MGIKIKTFGYRGAISPLSQLEKTFVEMGHEIIDENESADLIFDLTGFFENAIEYSKKYPKAIKIFNLLSVDINNPNWGDGRDVKWQLSQANFVTTVSESTKKDIKERTGIDCHVIYFPIKQIKEIITLKIIEFLYVGRLFNIEKRFENVVQTINLLGHPGGRLVVVGPENPNMHPLLGSYVGMKTDEELNVLYNRSKYLLCPCEYEGSLSMFEAILGNCIPIVSLDNQWTYEFGLEKLACYPDPSSIVKKVREIEANYSNYLGLIDKLKPQIIERFGDINIARRILNLYESAKN